MLSEHAVSCKTRLLRVFCYLKLAIANILVYLFALTILDVSHVFLSAPYRTVTHGGSCPRPSLSIDSGEA